MALHSSLRPAPSSAEPVVVAVVRPQASVSMKPVASGRPPLEEMAGLQLFGIVRTPPTMPALPAAAVASAPAVEPVTPVLPGALRGVLRSPQGTARILIEGADGQVRAIAAGEMIDTEWRLQTLEARQALVEHLPSRTQQVLPLPAES